MSAPRFAGLQDTLRAMSRPVSGERIAAIRAAAKGGTTSPSPAPAVATRTAAAEPKPVAAAKPKALERQTAEADDRAWQVPPEIAAQGTIRAEGYRLAFEATTDQLRRMSRTRAGRGRVGSLIAMVAAGASDREIQSNLGTKQTDGQLAASAMWDRAIVRVCGSLAPGARAAEQQAPREAARARMLAVASHPYFHGNEQKALRYLTSDALMPVSAHGIMNLVAMQNGERRSIEAWAGDLHPAWARAIAAVFPAS